MATAEIIRAPKTGALTAFASITQNFREWRIRRATYLSLAKLSDHELSDIGRSEERRVGKD